VAPDLSLGSLRAGSQRRLFAHYPWHIAFLVIGICALGLWNLASAARTAHGQVWISQLQAMGIGLAVAFMIAFLDYRVFMRVAYVFYGAVVLLLLMVLVKGHVVMGARRWIMIGPVNFQPSELAKIAVALALARYFHFDSEKRKDGYGLINLAIPMIITLVPAVLILKEPDLGTAVIVASIGVSMILFAGVRWGTLAVLGVVVVLGAGFSWQHLKPYQRKRVETFLNPEGDALGAGYHATQSIIAVGSGQALGKGWGQGTQTRLRFLPEQHTDFIFSVWAEEHGFFGCLLLLLLFYALVASGITVVGNARDRFGHFLAAGITSMFFWHAFINMGMVTGVMPVVGVTLPFMSYGGSSALVSFLAAGLLADVGMRRFVN
jgi:rod shape determining protein RodA